jgi:hypothetical protein
LSLTKKEAITFAKSEWWKTKTNYEIIREERRSMCIRLLRLG